MHETVRISQHLVLLICGCISERFINTDRIEVVMAWDYRRYVLASLPPDPPGKSSQSRTPATELAFTTKKIEANFSNFSAWHQRSKVYAVTGQISDPSIRDAG
jgi:hypothetical protein